MEEVHSGQILQNREANTKRESPGLSFGLTNTLLMSLTMRATHAVDCITTTAQVLYLSLDLSWGSWKLAFTVGLGQKLRFGTMQPGTSRRCRRRSLLPRPDSAWPRVPR